VRAVRVADFLSQSAGTAHPHYRRCVDREHQEGHAVLCDPADGGGFLSPLLCPPPVRASRFLSTAFPDEGLVHYSDAATDLMARRAKRSVDQLRSLAEELTELEPVPLVKLRYEDDAGGAEHLWFRVHGFQDGAVDAELVNTPSRIARLNEGDRGLHPMERLSDWVLMTPVGRIDPRQTRTLRQIRENWDEIRALVAESRNPE
jgi:hypothetical protein